MALLACISFSVESESWLYHVFANASRFFFWPVTVLAAPVKVHDYRG